MRKKGLLLISLCSLVSLLNGCGSGEPTSQFGSTNDSCSLQIDQNSWQLTSSPNQAVFPITNYYASVQALTNNCGSMFSGSKDIAISVNFNSTVSNFVGQQLALIAFSIGGKNLVENDTAYNFTSGNLKGTVVDSRSNSNWKAPLSDPGFMIFTFQIPLSILSQINLYPSGNIYIDQLN